MTESIHETLQDRMPEVAAGRAAWTTADAAHLAGCGECRAAWEVVRVAARVGRQVERTFDATGAAAIVHARLRARGASRFTLRRVALGITAIAAVIALTVLTRSPAPAPAAVAGRSLPAGVRFLPELDSLSADELTTVAEELDQPAADLESADGQHFFELDSTQLERVLRSLEG